MSKSISLFSSEFVDAVRKVIADRVSTDLRVDRHSVAREVMASLGLKRGVDQVASMVGSAVVLGVADTNTQRFTLARGRFGGIREIDVEATRQATRRHRLAVKAGKRAAEVRWSKRNEATAAESEAATA